VRDRGVSMIEILFAIVLMGLVMGAILTTLRVTIMASATDRDHANAHAWLQTSADVLYARTLVPCAPANVTATNIPAIIAERSLGLASGVCAGANCADMNRLEA